MGQSRCSRSRITKSRAHHCGDNGLVETKNGEVIRKHIGFGYIDAKHAEAIDQFHREHLNPYVNFHRPCAVPQIVFYFANLNKLDKAVGE